MNEEEYLDWSSKQGKILTCDNKANDYFTAERGFPFHENDLPHYHMIKEDCEITFKRWYLDFSFSKYNGLLAGVVGAWKRPLFIGCNLCEKNIDNTG